MVIQKGAERVDRIRAVACVGRLPSVDGNTEGSRAGRFDRRAVACVGRLPSDDDSIKEGSARKYNTE